MAKSILPKPSLYTITLTDEQHAAHWELIRYGSLMAQHFHRAWFVNFDESEAQSAEVRFEAALVQLLNYLTQGKQYAKRWDEYGLEHGLLEVYRQAKATEASEVV